MSADRALTTSPMLFGYCARDGRLAACDARNGGRFRLSSGRAAEIALAFLEPRSDAAAEQAGFTATELEQARKAGILVSGEEAESAELWERSGWSRPAYLMFSQMDIPYRDSGDPTDDRDALTEVRRAAVDGYQSTQRYPAPAPLAAGAPLELPSPPAPTTRLEGLTSRRSARAFSGSPPGAEQMAGVLHAATHGFRTVAAYREDEDPFRLLNSFLSWAHLFVVVQEVEGAPRGVFEYDWMDHRLLRAADPPTDQALLGCVQGQRWVLGTGFTIFVVADLRGYAWLYRHSRAYLHVLIQVGELGQEILMAATGLGLGGWTTPAVHESRAAAVLGLPPDDAVDALSIVRLGRPRGQRAG